jgi:hypothetical protein
MCRENSEQCWLQTLKDGIFGKSDAGWGDIVKLVGSGGGILRPNAENISIGGRITNSSKEKSNGEVCLVGWLDKG